MLEQVTSFLEGRGLEVRDLERVPDGARFAAVLADEPSPWELFVVVDEADRRVAIYSVEPLEVPPHQRADIAVLLTRVNFGLVIGNYELDLGDGEIRFKTSVDLGDLEPSPALLGGMLDANITAMQTYGDAIRSVILGIADADGALAAVEG